MSAKHLVIATLVALIAVGGWLLTDDRLNGGTNTKEPDISAAHQHHSQISFSRKEPLNFGALAGGHSNRYIQLSPDGAIHTSGPNVDQSNRTYIGDVNSRKFTGRRYQIQPGRLTFKVTPARKDKFILVKFLPGELKSGVTLSRLDMRTGPDTNGVRILNRSRRPNEIMFQIVDDRQYRRGNRSSGPVEIDLVYGGKLTLAGYITSDVDAHMSVKVSIQSHSQFNYH